MAVAMSFAQAPPISVPLRFFLTAPLFGVLAGVLLAVDAPDIRASRWSGETLALVHLMTLGLMLQTMAGALLQVLPVAVGANVWRPRLIAGVTHVGTLAGLLALAGGFLSGDPSLFRVAAPLLGGSLLVFLIAVGAALLGLRPASAALTALRGAVLALAVTVSLGVAALAVLGWGAGLPLPFPTLATLHAGWGLLGWALLLLAAVALLVVPMLQLTPPYARRAAQVFPAALLGALLLWSAAEAAGAAAQALRLVALLALAALGAGFGIATLRLQQRRRRRQPDATLLFWRTGMIALCLAAALLPLAAAVPRWAEELGMAGGAVLLFGVFASVINGMVYKILPFLIWLHLQQRVAQAPTVNQVIGEAGMRPQLYVHWAALGLLGLGFAWTPLLAIGGALFALSCAWLELNLVRAARRHLRPMLATVAAPV